MLQAEREFVRPEELATKVNKYIVSHHEGEKTLRDNGQIDVFESLQHHLEAGNRIGYITIPTQSGKGVLYTEFVEVIGLRTLVVTYSQELVRRAEQKFRDFAPGIETGKVYRYEHEFEKPVTITTYNSFIKHVESGKINPDDYDLVICDESDLALTEKRKAALSKFPQAIIIGLTASDTYSLDKNMDQVYGKCIHRITIAEAARMGMISGFSANLAVVNADITGVHLYRDDYDAKELDEALTASTASEASVQVYKALLADKPTIAHWPGVNMAEKAAEKFREYLFLAPLENKKVTWKLL